MGNVPLRPVGMDEFVEGLKGISNFEPDKVWGYVQAHQVLPETVKPYCYFSPACYTRNLIFKNDDFELLAICWEIGQVSRVHNHRDQMCWMTVPMGKLKTQNYAVRDKDLKKQTCRLEPTDTYLITPEAPAQVDPEHPVHEVLNPEEFGERAVSLHIYSKPFDSCEVYQPERGSYCDVELCYTSEYGKLCDGETTASPA